ncbi:hypothetical protein Tco_0580995 [Tanacetum coccineum]
MAWMGRNADIKDGDSVNTPNVVFRCVSYFGGVTGIKIRMLPSTQIQLVVRKRRCEWYIAPCFMNGLDAYNDEINLAFDENLISNEYAVKLCLDYEVKKGNKVVNKELIVALKGGLYFVKFIINPKEDVVEPGVIFGRSFTRLVKGIVDFGSGVIIVYPEQDPFEKDSEKTDKIMDDWDQLLDFNFDDLPQLVEKNFRRLYKKMLDMIWKDKVELDRMIVKEEEEAINKVKGEALKEKDDPGVFIFPIRFEGKINENALADTGTYGNTYECSLSGGVTTITAKFLILDIPIDRDAPIVVGQGFLYTIGGIVNTQERLFSSFDRICHQTFRAARSDVLRTA